MKTAVYRITILLISALIILSLPLAANAEQKKTYTVTVKNGQVFLNGKQLTKSASQKSQPVISPDRKSIVYVCAFKDGSIRLGTVNTGTKAEKIIKIDRQYTQITGIEWLSNSKIGINVHINPSLDSYQTYDAISGKNLNSYLGYGFIFNTAKSHVIYIQAPPHFSPQSGGYYVMLDNAALYKTDGKTALDNSLYPSGSFKRITFFEYNVKDETKSNIVILSIENNKVKSKVKIAWNKNICGLKWNNDDVLSIGNAASYDLKKSKLTLAGSGNEIKTLKDSGAQNNLQVGDQFNIVLKGNPSTGYGWYYTTDNKNIIEQLSIKEVPDKENVPGSGSTFTWNFKALKAGQVKLTYKYYRSAEGEASAAEDNIKEYVINIKD